MILTPEQIQYWRRWSLQLEPHVITSIFDSHELQRAEIEQLNSHIQQIAASHQSNTESLLEVARERDAVTNELARVTKEREEIKARLVEYLKSTEARDRPYSTMRKVLYILLEPKEVNEIEATWLRA